MADRVGVRERVAAARAHHAAADRCPSSNRPTKSSASASSASLTHLGSRSSRSMVRSMGGIPSRLKRAPSCWARSHRPYRRRFRLAARGQRGRLSRSPSGDRRLCGDTRILGAVLQGLVNPAAQLVIIHLVSGVRPILQGPPGPSCGAARHQRATAPRGSAGSRGVPPSSVIGTAQCSADL
jgi:hypothetical protein